MPAFQNSEQQNQFIPEASPSLKARLNYVSPSGRVFNIVFPKLIIYCIYFMI